MLGWQRRRDCSTPHPQHKKRSTSPALITGKSSQNLPLPLTGSALHFLSSLIRHCLIIKGDILGRAWLVISRAEVEGRGCLSFSRSSTVSYLESIPYRVSASVYNQLLFTLHKKNTPLNAGLPACTFQTPILIPTDFFGHRA